MRLRLTGWRSTPDLAIRRDADGQIFVAGLAVKTDGEKGDFAQWLLDQRRIVIRNARLVLARRPARGRRAGARQAGVPPRQQRRPPPFRPHRPAAQPPGGHPRPARRPARRDPAKPAEWRGELYAGLDYADLGAWRQWVDYPLAVDGAGGLRVWSSPTAGWPSPPILRCATPAPGWGGAGGHPAGAAPAACATATRTA
jgi:hypothetical protein